MLYESDRNMPLGSIQSPPTWIRELPAQEKACHAIQMSDVEHLREALAEGADLHNPIRPLLPEAAQRQHTISCEYLLARGAQVNFPNTLGQTAAFFAAQAGKRELLEILLAHGADVTRTDRWKTSPLMTAAFHGHLNCVEFLVGQGVDVNARDEDGLSILGHARHGRAAFAWQRRRSIRELREHFSDGDLSFEQLEEAIAEDFEWLRNQEEKYARIRRFLVRAGATDCETPVPRLSVPKVGESEES